MTLTIPSLAPGMNTLLRMHFRSYGKIRDTWQTQIRAAAGTKRFDGPCSVSIVRYYASNAMDLDNLYSTCKIPLDALVRAKVLNDDNPDAVADLTCKQVKVATRKEERTEIELIGHGTYTGKNP
jgi:Holliday junction resolvase RusA-like endonuclease